MKNGSQQEAIKEHLKEQFGLSDEKVEVMLPSFIAILADHLRKLEADVAEGELVAVSQAAHTLKGALLNLGLSDMADLAKTLEQGGKQENRQLDYEGLVEQLGKILKRL